jgi:hypothetical protein
VVNLEAKKVHNCWEGTFHSTRATAKTNVSELPQRFRPGSTVLESPCKSRGSCFDLVGRFLDGSGVDVGSIRYKGDCTRGFFLSGATEQLASATFQQLSGWNGMPDITADPRSSV